MLTKKQATQLKNNTPKQPCVTLTHSVATAREIECTVQKLARTCFGLDHAQLQLHNNLPLLMRN